MATGAQQSLLVDRPSPIVAFLGLSAAGHAALVGLGIAFSWLYQAPRIDLDQKPIMASLVRQGKKRDEQLLPRKEELPPPPDEAKIPIPTPNAPKVDPKPKVSSDKAQPNQKKSLFDAFSKTAKPSELEGEENGDPNGDSAKQEGERYFGIIRSAVRRHYDVSNTIAEADRIQLKADVAIRLDELGALVDVKLVRASGNDVFDDAVIGAVKKAAPFGPPPPALAGPLKKDGVQLRFTP